MDTNRIEIYPKNGSTVWPTTGMKEQDLETKYHHRFLETKPQKLQEKRQDILHYCHDNHGTEISIRAVFDSEIVVSISTIVHIEKLMSTEPAPRHGLQVSGDVIILSFLKVGRNARTWRALIRRSIPGRPGRSVHVEAAALGSFCQRLLNENSRNDYMDSYSVPAHMHTQGFPYYLTVSPTLGACGRRAIYQCAHLISPSLLLRGPCGGHRYAVGSARETAGRVHH
ncbi:hypothetical protein LAZ67_20002639 [Cordylochernes scorpioides]|uniref:Uncharacterized protein n=1 Tax=Cordylochernes scorpioides TaxID=51811 RepID=A0ABY6LMJ5_9ARAC|nr:hypothetical protein LAZ67_20002639 [Cordylochernes scorpioides]